MMKEKTKIKAEIVADSIDPRGNRLTSVLAVMPRIIIAEMNTHRMLSKNTSSSRAVPFKKMVEAVQNDPFIPVAWQKNHSGMQGTEYFTDELSIQFARTNWLTARDNAIKSAMSLHSTDNGYGSVTKQLCNRLLEPFMWTTMLITGSKEGWDNFFELRCPQYEYKLGVETYYFKSWKELISFIKSTTDTKDYIKSWEDETVLGKLQHNKGQAEIHMMALAEAIYDAMNESTPKQLKPGEWHIPFEDKISSNILDWSDNIKTQAELWGRDLTMYKIKVSVAMAARTSYTVIGDEKEIDYEKMIKLHDKLIEMKHSSPLEHCARAMSDEEYYNFVKGVTLEYNEGNRVFSEASYGHCKNFKGFIQYRYFVEEKI